MDMRNFDRYIMGGIPEETGYERGYRYIQNIKTRKKYDCDEVFVSKDNRYIILINDDYLNKNFKQGILETSSGNYTKQIYDNIVPFFDSFLVSKDGKKGILNEELKLTVPIIYNEIDCVHYVDSYYVYDSKFEDDFRYPFAIVKKDNNLGLLDFKTGGVIIPCSQDISEITKFTNDIVKLVRKGKIEFYDGSKNSLLPLPYQKIKKRKDGCYDVKIGRYYGLVDQEFKEVAPCIYEDSVGEFRKFGFALVKKDGYSGLIDNQDEVIPCKYEEIEEFGNDGLCRAKYSGKWGIIDFFDKEIVPFVYDEILPYNNEGLAQVRKGGKNGYINYEFKEVVPCIYDIIEPFEENNLALIKRNGKYGYINRAYKEVIPCIYKSIKFIGKSSACVEAENLRYGIINLHGKVIVPCIYEKEISQYNKDGFVVKRNGRYGFVDRRGKEIVDCIWEENNLYQNDGYKITKINEKWEVVDKKNMNMVVFQSDSFESLFSVMASEMVKYNKEGNPQIVSYCRRHSKCFVGRDNNLFYGRLRDSFLSSEYMSSYLEMSADEDNYNATLRVIISNKNENIFPTEGYLSFVCPNSFSVSYKIIGGKITYSSLSHRYISTALISVTEADLFKILSQNTTGCIQYNGEKTPIVINISSDSYLFMKYLICPQMCSEEQTTHLKGLTEIELQKEKNSLKEDAQEDEEARCEYERTLALRDEQLTKAKNRPHQTKEHSRNVVEQREKRREEAYRKATQEEAIRKEVEDNKKKRDDEFRVQQLKKIQSQKVDLEKLIREYRYKLNYPFGRLVRWVVWFVLFFFSLVFSKSVYYHDGWFFCLFYFAMVIYPIICFIYFLNREKQDDDYKDAIKSIKKELKDLERKENDIS